MDEQILENFATLPEHEYPYWVKLFGIVIIIATVYSSISLPEYFIAAKNMKTAQIAYQSGDYVEAIKFYKNVLAVAPASKVARIGMAEAAFSTDDRNSHIIALSVLEGIALDEKNWSKITAVMPMEYREYFSEVER